MGALTWLHLSDWHQEGSEFLREKVRDALVRDIKGRVEISPDLAEIDFIAFTGDVAYHGEENEYRAAAKGLFDPLLEAAGVDLERFFVVPGNHDLEWGRLDDLPPRLNTVPDATQTVHEWLRSDSDRAALLKPMSSYSKAIKAYFGKHAHSVEPAYGYARQFDVDGKKIAVLGLNSAWLSGRHRAAGGALGDQGSLVVGEPQYYHLLRDSENAELRIAILHHPLDWLADFDRLQSESSLGSKCHFILRGHQHVQQVQVVFSTVGSYLTVPGGACYDRPSPAAGAIYPNAYNFVHLDFEHRWGVVYLRKWSSIRDGGRWIPDIDTWEAGQFSFQLPRKDDDRHRVLRTPARPASATIRVTVEPSLPRASAIFNRGQIQLSQGRYEKALTDFQQAAELEPNNPLVFAAIGQTYSLMGSYEDALAHYSRAIELGPDLAEPYALRGETYRLLGQDVEALADLDLAITLDPDCISAVASRAQVYLSRKHCGKALADFKMAIEQLPDNALLIAGRGETYRLMRRYEDAVRDLSRAIELEPGSASFYISRGLAEQSLRHHDDALADFNRAIDLDHSNPLAFVGRAETHAVMGHHDDALADYTTAIDLDPRYIAAVGSAMRMPGRLPPVARST